MTALAKRNQLDENATFSFEKASKFNPEYRRISVNTFNSFLNKRKTTQNTVIAIKKTLKDKGITYLDPHTVMSNPTEENLQHFDPVLRTRIKEHYIALINHNIAKQGVTLETPITASDFFDGYDKVVEAPEELPTESKDKHVFDNVDVSEDQLKRIQENLRAKAQQANSSDAPSNRQQHQQKILWQPHEGPQTWFLESPEFEVLFCGGRATGKSDCLLVDPLRWINDPEFSGLVLRRTIPALRDLITRAQRLYPKVCKGVVWNEQSKIFKFPSGATLEFGYYDHITDYDRYHGREFCWLGVDELSQYPDIEYYDRIKSVVRSTAKHIPLRIRLTTNPNGPGRSWIKEYFLDKADNNKTYKEMFSIGNMEIALTRKYVKATVFDNPTMLEQNPQYVAQLMALPEVQRKQWLEGDFDVDDGIAFPEFSPNIHVIEPFKVPQSWLKFRGCDWGYKSLAVCLWFAVDPEDKTVYIYRELAVKEVTADVFARMVLDLEYQDGNIQYGIIDSHVGDQRGLSGPTIDELMRQQGLVWTYADQRSASRIHGKQLIHSYLKVNEVSNKPFVQIFNTCKELTRELNSLPVDPNNSEDVDTKKEDHAYDAMRYGLSSRQIASSTTPYYSNYDSWGWSRQEHICVDSRYGY